jgi:hypothetical protein
MRVSRLSCYLLFPAVCAIAWLSIEPGRLLHLGEMVIVGGLVGEALYQLLPLSGGLRDDD